jgi:hypothetical protein
MFSEFVNVSSMHAREETPLKIRAGFDIVFKLLSRSPDAADAQHPSIQAARSFDRPHPSILA